MTARSSAGSRLVSESLVYTTIDAAQNLVALLVVPASLYWLTPADMGVVTLALLGTQFVMGIGALGLDFAVIRYYLAWPAAHRPGRVAGALSIVMLWAAFLMLAAVVVLRRYPMMHDGAALLAIAAGAGLAVRAVPLAAFRVDSRLRDYGVVMIAGSVLQAVVQLAALAAGFDVIGFLAGAAIAAWSSAALAIVLLQRSGTGRPLWPDPPAARLAAFNLASGVLNRVLASSDRIALLIWSTVDTLGVYGTAVRWSLPLRMLSGGTKLAVAPALSRAEQDGSHTMEAPIGAYLSLLALVAVLLICLSSGLLLTPWRDVTVEFQRLLSILLLAQLFGCLTLIGQVVLYYRGQSIRSTALAAMSLVLTVAGVLWLVPRYGAMGAAMAQLGASAVTLLVLGIGAAAASQRFPVLRALGPVAVAGAAPWLFGPVGTAIVSFAGCLLLGLRAWPDVRASLRFARVFPT